MKLHEMLEAMPRGAKLTIDLTSLGVVAGALANILPSAAAFLSIVWLLWQMWDRWKYGPKQLRGGRE